MPSIDRADWHLNENFPENLPEENSATHIGMYINWIIDNNLIGEIHTQDSIEGINAVKMKKITGRDFFFDYCDGKFWNDDLNAIGLIFTENYYSSNRYYEDYLSNLDNGGKTIFTIENSLENYEKLKKVIDKRFKTWELKMNKKPWEFWK
jgi:hypothetical protein